MSSYIYDQLKQVNLADLSNYDANTNTFHIKRYAAPQYDIGKCYIVRVNNHLINNTTSVLAINWNNATAPQHEYYKVFISKLMNKMIYVDGIAVDTNWQSIGTTWSGWLPLDSITQITTI